MSAKYTVCEMLPLFLSTGTLTLTYLTTSNVGFVLYVFQIVNKLEFNKVTHKQNVRLLQFPFSIIGRSHLYMFTVFVFYQ